MEGRGWAILTNMKSHPSSSPDSTLLSTQSEIPHTIPIITPYTNPPLPPTCPTLASSLPLLPTHSHQSTTTIYSKPYSGPYPNLLAPSYQFHIIPDSMVILPLCNPTHLTTTPTNDHIYLLPTPAYLYSIHS